MTEALKALFEEKEIRAIEQDGQILFPLADLTAAWGVHRNTLPELIDRHPERFNGFHTTIAHVTCAGLRAVNEPGLYLLMGAVSTKRLKNAEAAAAILRFQRWVPELIQRYRKGETAPVSVRLLSDDVREALKVARIISEETGISLPIAQSFALETVGAGKWQELLPAATMPTGYLTPTDIGLRIGYSAVQVNKWLYNNKLQIRDSVTGDWRLTEAGKMHAEEFPFTKNKHSGYQIKWRDSIFPLMNMNSGGQTALGSG